MATVDFEFFIVGHHEFLSGNRIYINFNIMTKIEATTLMDAAFHIRRKWFELGPTSDLHLNLTFRIYHR